MSDAGKFIFPACVFVSDCYVLRHVDFGMFKCGPLHTKMRSFRHVSFFFPRASACLILASLILVICMQRCGPSGMFLRSACFGMFDFGMFDFGMFNYLM